MKWPGQAAVIVSVVNTCRGPVCGPYSLDNRDVGAITAYLFHAGGHEDPVRLMSNHGASFNGVKIYGSGFLFDDYDNSGSASPLSLMHAIVAADSRNAQLIQPYFGGEELNDDPSHRNRRWVINFGEMPEVEAMQWPALYEVVRRKVLPERLSVKDVRCRTLWWQFERPRTELFDAVRNLQWVIALSRVGQHAAFTRVRTGTVWADTVVVFKSDSFALYAVLQSRAHEMWARLCASSMKDDLRYTTSDCFDNFPFPSGVMERGSCDSHLPEDAQAGSLGSAGREYYEFRAALMVRNNEGLTKTYNRFHDPHETSADILQLRELHAAMDRAVLEAYGWHDLADKATCEFLLDYEEDEDDEESTGRSRKKPWRYRWPDVFRDEVLARLLDLNRQRAEEERLAEEAAAAEGAAGKKPARKAPRKTKRISGDEASLF